ncbi:MAG: hypothetical protein WBB28_22555 [Crinalium sp.]
MTDRQSPITNHQVKIRIIHHNCPVRQLDAIATEDALACNHAMPN